MCFLAFLLAAHVGQAVKPDEAVGAAQDIKPDEAVGAAEDVTAEDEVFKVPEVPKKRGFWGKINWLVKFCILNN